MDGATAPQRRGGYVYFDVIVAADRYQAYLLFGTPLSHFRYLGNMSDDRVRASWLVI